MVRCRLSKDGLLAWVKWQYPQASPNSHSPEVAIKRAQIRPPGTQEYATFQTQVMIPIDCKLERKEALQ